MIPPDLRHFRSWALVGFRKSSSPKNEMRLTYTRDPCTDQSDQMLHPFSKGSWICIPWNLLRSCDRKSKTPPSHIETNDLWVIYGFYHIFSHIFFALDPISWLWTSYSLAMAIFRGTYRNRVVRAPHGTPMVFPWHQRELHSNRYCFMISLIFDI